MDGLTKDPKTAEEAASWLKDRSKAIAENQPWFLEANFINPHDIMYYDTGDEEMLQASGTWRSRYSGVSQAIADHTTCILFRRPSVATAGLRNNKSQDDANRQIEKGDLI